MTEILAPAGDMNSALAAINAGADAIYLGFKEYSARSSAENFDFAALEEIINYAHAFGVKIYVAMNTLVKDSELQNFIKTLVAVWNKGADAIILSDIFIGKYIKEKYPEIVLHLSTQAGVCNVYAATLAKEYGFSRVILSRETALEDIKSIAKIIETEVFVQGALCTCFSGQCYLSSFAGGNSGNRGKCKQPCRKLYSIDRAGFEELSYKLSLSDLSVGKKIDELISAGVYSFKIEGRMRRAEYVSAAVTYYKKLLGGKDAVKSLSDLKRTYNRGNYTKGLAFGQDKSFLSPSVQGHIGEFIGVVKVENGKYLCLTREKRAAGDCFKILRDGKETGGATFLSSTRDGFVLSSKNKLKNGDKVFITTDASVNERLLSFKRTIPVKTEVFLKAGEVARVYVNGLEFCGEKPLDAALNRPLDVGGVKKCFDKTDIYPFEVSYGKILTENVFLPQSELNALRRKAYGGYFEELSRNKNVKYEVNSDGLPEIKPSKNDKLAVICKNTDGLKCDIAIFKPDDYFNFDFDKKSFAGKVFLYLPPYLKGREIERLKDKIKLFDGGYCDGIYAVKLFKELDKPLFIGTGFNLSNRLDVALCGGEYIALSKELTFEESKNLCAENVFVLTAGAVKVMDLIYCPFGKTCKTCDKRQNYRLTDENGREFPLLRYSAEVCRFEVYNCANLVSSVDGFGSLLDCSLEIDAKKVVNNYKNVEKLRDYFKNYTRGHSVQPVN